MSRRRQGWIWSVGSAVALIFLVGLALHGERPEAGLGRFVSAGPMVAPLPEQVESVEIARAQQHWTFRRGDGGRWLLETGPAVPDGIEVALMQGLNLLHDTAIERRLTREELTGVDHAPFGLDPPATIVTVRGAGHVFSVMFGAANPLGLARYARLGGTDEIVLLPSYVAATWEQAVGAGR